MSRLLSLLVVAALGAAACSAPAAAPSEPAPSTVEPVRIGAAPQSESRLLATIVRHLLEDAGIPAAVSVKENARDARRALELGEALGGVDVLPGYTGQTWLEYLDRPDPPGDPRTSYRRVRQIDADDGIVWLRPAFGSEQRIDRPPANATFAFFVRGTPSVNASIRTMSQLATRLGERPGSTLCIDEEFFRGPDGFGAVSRAYGIDDEDVRPFGVGPEDAVRGVAAGDCLAGLSTATDGDAWRAGLQPLRDDLDVFPAFVVAVQVTEDLLADRPEVEAAVRPLSRQLTTRLLGVWNARVAGRAPVEEVARDAATELSRREAPSPEVEPTS